MTEVEIEATAADWSTALDQARQALLDHLPKEAILARYQAAGGKEVLSGKFSNPQSSAALVANAFGFFIDPPDYFSIPIESLAEVPQQRYCWRPNCAFLGVAVTPAELRIVSFDNQG